jgi:hypothetical protein
VPQQLVQPLAREGRIVPVDPGRLSNFATVFPYFRESPFLNFDGKTWGGLVLFGANAIAYDRKRVPHVDSLEALFDEKYKGRTAVGTAPPAGREGSREIRTGGGGTGECRGRGGGRRGLRAGSTAARPGSGWGTRA